MAKCQHLSTLRKSSQIFLLTIPFALCDTLLLVVVPLQHFRAIVEIRRPGSSIFVHGAADERGARLWAWIGAVFRAHAAGGGYVGLGAGEIGSWGLGEDEGWEGYGERGGGEEEVVCVGG